MRPLLTTLTVLMMSLFVTSCANNTPISKTGEVVYVTKDVELWSTLSPEAKGRPLGEYEGTDILTPETARGIARNNKRLSK